MTESRSRSLRMAMRLLSRLVDERKNYGLFGDIEEIYNFHLSEKGRRRADTWLWIQVLKTIPPFLKNALFWNWVMFGNYLKIAIRNFKRQKTFSLINIAGLAVGMACCICILLYVRHELSYDRYHADADNIYRLVMTGEFSGRPFDVALSSGPIGPTLVREFPEVDNAVRFQHRGRTSINFRGKQFFEDRIYYADKTLFDIFTFPLLKGNPKSALQDPFTAVITQETAERYFGSTDPVGEILRFDKREEYLVTGVIKNVPENSHFAFDFLLSFTTLSSLRHPIDSWTQFTNYTYLHLKDGSDPEELVKKISPLNTMHMGFDPEDMGWDLVFTLQALPSIHLHSHLQNEMKGNSDISLVYIFSSIAALILILACINFMNLATARSSNRAKEVGLRKVLGAVRSKIVKQFLGESLIYSFSSLLVALILSGFTLPLLSSFLGYNLGIRFAKIASLIPGFFGIALFVGLAAGLYPAFILAGFQPARVVKGGFETSRQKKHLRNGLVIVQLAISTVLIIGTGVIFEQITFMKNKRLGFEKEHVIVVRISDDSVRASIPAIKRELKRLQGVLNVTASSHIPGWDGLAAAHLPEGFTNEESQSMRILRVDHDFLDTLGIELAAGRNFSPEFLSDPHESVLINETAALKFGWTDPLGKKIQEIYGTKQTKTVIGVIEDFHMSSLHSVIEPMYITSSHPEINVLCIRTSGGNFEGLLGSIRSTWAHIAPGVSFDYFFLDESFNRQYRAEERLSRLFSSFSLLAIFIACLGLFGMACYAAERRTKEIGIRKVLGASPTSIVYLLGQELIGIFLVANFVSWPLVYLASHKWLQNFAYRTEIGIKIFVMSTILTSVITFGTVGYQAIKASLANPAYTLKYE